MGGKKNAEVVIGCRLVRWQPSIQRPGSSKARPPDLMNSSEARIPAARPHCRDSPAGTGQSQAATVILTAGPATTTLDAAASVSTVGRVKRAWR